MGIAIDHSHVVAAYATSNASDFRVGEKYRVATWEEPSSHERKGSSLSICTLSCDDLNGLSRIEMLLKQSILRPVRQVYRHCAPKTSITSRRAMRSKSLLPLEGETHAQDQLSTSLVWKGMSAFDLTYLLTCRSRLRGDSQIFQHCQLACTGSHPGWAISIRAEGSVSLSIFKQTTWGFPIAVWRANNEYPVHAERLQLAKLTWKQSLMLVSPCLSVYRQVLFCLDMFA